MPSPLARCVQAAIPSRRYGTSPKRRLVGPGMATCGVVSPTGAHNNLSPPSSRAQSILWRAQHKPPTLSFMPLLRGRGLWGMRGCTGE